MICIVSPSFNEGQGLISFLKELESVLSGLDSSFRVIVVDDCSQDDSIELLSKWKMKSPNVNMDVLHLKFNVGQQGAIYQGLLYAADLQPEQVIVIDADGEDDPRAIPILLSKKNYQIVEVRRGRRHESILFRIAYFFYCLLFRFITGKIIDFGNYCMINRDILERIRYTSFVHLPAYLLKQKATVTRIKFDRGKRIKGDSKMGYKGLLLHAFKSMIEFGEDLLLLFLRLFFLNAILFIVLMADIFYQKFISHQAILGWFSTLALSLIILAVLSIGFFIIGVLLLNLIHQQNTKSYNKIYSVVRSTEHIPTTEIQE